MKQTVSNILRLGAAGCFFLSVCSSAFGIQLPSINKSKIRLSILPAKSQFGEIVVENTSSESRSMKVYLNDWNYLPVADGSKEFIPANTTPSSCASWITFSPAEFTLPPFGRQKISYEVKVPRDAAGGHYAALFFESVFGKMQAQQEELRAAVNLAIRIAVLFFVEPEGTVQRSGTVSKFSITPGTDTTNTFMFEFKNTGNSDCTAGSTYHVMDKNGLVKSRGQFNDVYALAGGIAQAKAVHASLLSPGTYTLVITVDMGKALQEANMGRGPVIVKEAQVVVDGRGRMSLVGEIK